MSQYENYPSTDIYLSKIIEIERGLTKMIARESDYYKKFNPDLLEACRNFFRYLTKDDKKIYKFATCSPESLKDSLRKYVVLSLKMRPGGDNLYLIPYKKVCKLTIGYRGLEQLLMRTKSIKYIKSMVITDNQRWSIVDSVPKENIADELREDEFDEKNIKGAVAWIKMLDGDIISERLTSKQIQQARKKSTNSADDSPWILFYSEMARKTAIRRLIKHTMEAVYFNLDERLEKQFEIALEEQIPQEEAVEEEIESDAITTLEDFEEGLDDE